MHFKHFWLERHGRQFCLCSLPHLHQCPDRLQCGTSWTRSGGRFCHAPRWDHGVCAKELHHVPGDVHDGFYGPNYRGWKLWSEVTYESCRFVTHSIPYRSMANVFSIKCPKEFNFHMHVAKVICSTYLASSDNLALYQYFHSRWRSWVISNCGTMVHHFQNKGN